MNGGSEGRRTRSSIRTRFLVIVLLTTLLGLVAASGTAIFCIRWIRRSATENFTVQLERNVRSAVEQTAASADAKLEHYEKYIELVTDYIENMYLHEDEMIARGREYYAPTDTAEYMLTAGYFLEDPDVESYREERLFFSNLEQLWEPIAKANENLITTLYAGTVDGLMTSYDHWSYLSVPQEGKQMYYDYREADWYRQGLEEDGTFYTGLYTDSQGRGLTVTAASPFRDAQGQIAGVDAADFDITGLYDEMLATDLGEGSFSFALDQTGALISPDSETSSFEAQTGLTPEEMDSLIADPDGIMEKDGAVYVCVPIERVGWTLCACVLAEVFQGDLRAADSSISHAYAAFIGIALAILILEIFAVNLAVTGVTRPLELLGRDMKIISDGNIDYRPEVSRNDEIGDIVSGMNEMLDRLNAVRSELALSQEQRDAMSHLARHDALTGIRNKMAFNEEVSALRQELAAGEQNFGFAMVDLNNLKTINDSFGHDKGDIMIRNICRIICTVFCHSPVFRIGGDEFVVLLKNDDYRNIAALTGEFTSMVEQSCSEPGLPPWEKSSAAIGYALYDPASDRSVDEVLERADREMYRNKVAMKSPV